MQLNKLATSDSSQVRSTRYVPADTVSDLCARAEHHMTMADACAERGLDALADYFWQRGARTSALAVDLAEQHELVHV